MIEDLKQKTVSSLAWKLFERGGYLLIQLVVQIVLARLLSPTEFGLLAIILVFINVGNIIVQSGLGTALVQSSKVDDSDFSTVFWISFGISLLLYLVIFFAAPAIALFYESEVLVWPLRVVALALVIGAYNATQVAKVQRELVYKKFFWATLASVLVSGTAGIATALLGAGIWALAIQQIVYQLTYCVVLAVQVDWKPRLVFNPQRAGVLFKFGWKLLASSLLDLGYQNLSDLAVGRQFGVSKLGLVSQGKKYPNALFSMIDCAIRSVLFSVVSRAQKDIASVKRIVRRFLKTSTYLVIPFMVFFAVVAGPLIQLLLGEQWQGCVPFFQMYCIIFALYPILDINIDATNGVGRSDLCLKLQIVKTAFGVLMLLFTCFVLQDVYAVVLGYLIALLFSIIVTALPNKRVVCYSFSEQIRDAGPAILLTLSATAAALPIALIGLWPVVQILVQFVVMAAVYLLLSRLFHVEEFSYLVSMSKDLLRSRKHD